MRDPRLVNFAKSMGREMTEPERRLWEQLRAKRFKGIKFGRQNVVSRYIADVYSRDVTTIVEVNGDSHGFQHDYDAVREACFNGLGFQVIRYMNKEVMANSEGVMPDLEMRLTASLATLSPEGEMSL